MVNGRKKQRKRRKTRLRVLSRSWQRATKSESLLPPNENLQKFPDETYGDMQLPFARGKSDRASGR